MGHAGDSCRNRFDPDTSAELGKLGGVEDPREMQLLAKIWSVSWRVLLFFLVWGILLAPGYLLVVGEGEGGQAELGPGTRLGLEALAALAVLLAAWLLVRFVDRRGFVSLGFAGGRTGRDLLVGLALGAAMIALAVGLLAVAGWATTCSAAAFSWPVLALLGGALVCNSVTQEVLVRGYVLQTVEGRFGTAAALIVSSLVFVALHGGAIVEGGPLPAINLLAAGLLLGLAYTTTRNLWLPIALHFSWNFLQGPLLGIAVSGQALDGGWRLLSLQGPTLFTGGRFGLEGGLAATVATVAAIVALIAAARGPTRSGTAASPASPPPR